MLSAIKDIHINIFICILLKESKLKILLDQGIIYIKM